MRVLQKLSREWRRFFLSIVLPAFGAVLLSVLAIYFIVIPAFEKSFLDGKKTMIEELAKTAWSIMEFYYRQEQAGTLSRGEAQRRALAMMRTLRYGEENRDYFWVTDATPSLVMHPYSEELVGVDLSGFTDAQGKKLFVEIERLAESRQSGFIDYSWNKKYTREVTVPKLSFVKRFEPWGWVVGTGVFLDDVKRKTREISARLSRLGMAAVILLTGILFYVGRQSYLFEWQRNQVQQELAKSRVKYKRLVETATEPMLMFYEGRCIYSNRALQNLLGRSAAALEEMRAGDILRDAEEGELQLFKEDGTVRECRCPARLLPSRGGEVEVVVTVSRMNLDGREAAVVSIRDESGTRRMERALDESREKYRQLTSRLHIGIFRAEAERGLPIIEANQAVSELLALEGEAAGRSLQEILASKGVPEDLLAAVRAENYLKNKIIELHLEGGVRSLSLSLVLAGGAGEMLYIDGIMEDVSEARRREADREKLIVDLQTSLLFLNQPVAHVQGQYLVCDAQTPLYQAAERMRDAASSSLLIADEEGEIIGIATDMALRQRVVAGRMDYTAPVGEIMSKPLIFIDQSALIFEAVMLMEEKGVKHLVVRDGSGKPLKVVSNEDLLNVHRYSSTFLLREIQDARSTEEVVASHERLPRIIKSLVDSGAHARNITRITAMISDGVLVKFLQFAIDELGDPPARFAFISLGSDGREEQTLATDQDNALIFEDVGEERLAEVKEYFLALSTKVCTWLDQAGYVFCKGEVMAMNPKWCQPLAVWKDYFSAWITESKPKDLLEVSIFFDFRSLYGDEKLVRELRAHITRRVANRDAFFYQLAQNALLFKLPVDFFGNISVDSGGEHPNTFNIKHVIALIVGYARIYAITFALEETNTLQRLDRLKSKSFIGKELHDDVTEAYNYLMQIRFTHQVDRLDNGLAPDNHISLDELNYMEKSALKKIFAQVGQLQNKLNAIGKVEIFF